MLINYTMRFVYILRCKDNTLYTGITKDTQRRLEEHNSSPLGAKYTKARRPVHLVRQKSCTNRSEASSWEHKIKKMTKQQKEKLIIAKKIDNYILTV